LEIYYDETRNAWYASIPVEVGVEKTKRERRANILFMVKGKKLELNHLKVTKLLQLT